MPHVWSSNDKMTITVCGFCKPNVSLVGLILTLSATSSQVGCYSSITQRWTTFNLDTKLYLNVKIIFLRKKADWKDNSFNYKKTWPKHYSPTSRQFQGWNSVLVETTVNAQFSVKIESLVWNLIFNAGFFWITACCSLFSCENVNNVTNPHDNYY